MALLFESMIEYRRSFLDLLPIVQLYYALDEVHAVQLRFIDVVLHFLVTRMRRTNVCRRL